MRLNQEGADRLNTELTLEEIRQAIRELKSKRAPGPEGLTPEFY